MSRFSSNRLAALLGATTLIAACDIGTVTVPRTASTVVVHAVLNPSFRTQVVLVERTLTGALTVRDTGFDANDPIVSAGGIPVSGAAVEILDSTGLSYPGIEERTIATDSGKGAGVYRVALPGSSLVFGARYQLRVRTTSGEQLTAFARLPRAIVRGLGGLTRTFNRDRDTLLLAWAAADAARTYAVRIESPFGPFFFFTDRTRIRLTGDLRNLFAKDLPRALIPGFRQGIVVTAVDSNFYDYYRTNNDPFTGSGIISRVAGGGGLFGAVVELRTGTLAVVADQHGGIEGRFRRAGSGAPAGITQLTLYVESPPTRSGLPEALSGQYLTLGQESGGLIGKLHDSTVTLALLANQLAVDTGAVFTGVLRGDTLVGSYRNVPGVAIYLRTP